MNNDERQLLLEELDIKMELAECYARLQKNPDFVKLFKHHFLKNVLRDSTLSMYKSPAHKELYEPTVSALAWLQNALDNIVSEAEDAEKNIKFLREQD